uniref:Essential protein Yae1 N-terminal domain-containing protein n=1 Tax=Poecilia mexicana TaxID=48701 RepID=A0A3B3Z558_9TELE
MEERCPITDSSILLIESFCLSSVRFRGEGYQEGFQRGTKRGLHNGWRHGASHGANLSSEISFYYGFAISWKCLLEHQSDDRSRKRLRALEALLNLTQKFPLDDPQSVKLQEDTEKLRAKFRQVDISLTRCSHNNSLTLCVLFL